MTQEQLLNSIIGYFRQEVFEPHLRNLEVDNAELSSYSANPFLTPYLSKVLEDEYNARGVAQVLYFSRVLSTSITTSFGSHIKKILVENKLAESRSKKANVISFTDHTTGLLTGCVLKAGPNTINSGDKSGIRRKLKSIAGVDRLALGIIYGSESKLNSSYTSLQKSYDIFVGKVFWHRITGFEDFYDNLETRMRNLPIELNTEGRFDNGLERLTQQIENSFF